MRWWWIVLVMMWGQVVALHAQGCPESRLAAGGQAQVVGTPNRLRDAPSTSGARLGEIPAGRPFTVLEIGGCQNDIRWVRVSYEGLEGWTAEAVGAEYYLVPLAAAPVEAEAVATAPTSAPSTATTTDPNLTEVVNRLNAAPWQGGCGLPPRLGLHTFITPISDPVRIRQAPSRRAEVIGSIPVRGQVRVQNVHAVCNEGLTWQYVLQERGAEFTYGWVAESDANEAFVQLATNETAGRRDLEPVWVNELAWAGDQVLVAFNTGVVIVPATAEGSAPLNTLWGADTGVVQSSLNPVESWVQIEYLGFIYNAAANTLESSFDTRNVTFLRLTPTLWGNDGLLLQTSFLFLLINPTTGGVLREVGTDDIDPPGLRTRYLSPPAAYSPVIGKVGVAIAEPAVRRPTGGMTDDEGFIGLYDPASRAYTPFATGSDAVRENPRNPTLRPTPGWKVGFSPRGTYFVSFNTLWNSVTGARVIQLQNRPLAFSFDERHVATVSGVFALPGGEQVLTLNRVDNASFNQEGTRLAVAYWRLTGIVLEIYDTTTWTLLNTLDLTWLMQ